MKSAPGPALNEPAPSADSLEARRRCLRLAGVDTTMSAFGPRVPAWPGPPRAEPRQKGKVEEAYQHQDIMSSTAPMTARVSETIGCRDIVVVGHLLAVWRA
jgi:hypothetical protein